MIRKVIILLLFIFIQKSKIIQSKKWKAEELWEKTKENFTEMKEKRYLLSDIENIFNETEKKKLTYEIIGLSINILSNPYVFIINNICCGDLKDENFLNEYTKTLSNLINKDFGTVNDKKTIILLLIFEENIYKINIVGSTIKKVIGLEELKSIYSTINNCLKKKDYYSVIADTCTAIRWIYDVKDINDYDDDDEEIDKKDKDNKEKKEKEDKEKKEKDDKEKKEKDDKEKEEQEINDDEKKNKNNENLNNKNNGNTLLIVIIIFLVFSFCLVLILFFKMCKKVKILNSEKINFNLYEKLKV